MQNVIFAGAGAAVATIHVEGEIAETVRGEVSESHNVINVTVRPALP